MDYNGIKFNVNGDKSKFIYTISEIYNDAYELMARVTWYDNDDEMFKHTSYPLTTVKRNFDKEIWIKNIKGDRKLKIDNLNKIANFDINEELDNLDDLIDLVEKKVELLKQHRLGLVQELKRKGYIE